MSHARIKVGDVFEIRTTKGLAYAIYTNNHSDPPKYGALIRVFDKIFPARPTKMRDLLDVRVRFETFFPLQSAVNKGIFPIVGNLKVPEKLLTFPIFRTGMVDPKTKKISNWWLWDGQKEWPIGSLSPEQRKFPILGVWNDINLVQKLEEGWRPEIDSS